MVIPGMTARILIPNVVKNEPNTAFVALISEVLPVGFRGLMYAALLAALMSSLASVFHSASTLFTMDIYRKFRPYALQLINRLRGNARAVEEDGVVDDDKGCSGYEYVVVGRIAGVVITLLGILWIPLVPLLSQELYVYTHKVMSYMAPPISIVFLFGVCIKRVNSIAALLTLILGWTLGIGRLILEVNLVKNHGQCSYADKSALFDKVVSFFVCINFLHFSALLSALLMTVMLLVSFATEKPREEQINGLTIDWDNVKAYFNFLTTNSQTNEESTVSDKHFWESERFMALTNIAAAGVLVSCLLVLYISFR